MSSTISFGLAGRIVVITGAANGIGAACARRLARDGARVALWDVAEAPGSALAAELRAAGSDACFIRCDVSSKASVDAAAATTISEFGRIDGLVNNAGIFRAAEFLDVTEEDWDAVINVNLKGSFLVGQAVARQMFLTHYSRITGVADCAARLGAMLDATVAAALAHRDAPDRLSALTAALMRLYGDGARAFGVALPDDRIDTLLLDDAALNAAGLIAWLDRPSRASARA